MPDKKQHAMLLTSFVGLKAAVTARRLKSLDGLLQPGTSLLLAWADGPVTQATTDTLTAPGSERLVLSFNPLKRGVVLGVN